MIRQEKGRGYMHTTPVAGNSYVQSQLGELPRLFLWNPSQPSIRGGLFRYGRYLASLDNYPQISEKSGYDLNSELDLLWGDSQNYFLSADMMP